TIQRRLAGQNLRAAKGTCSVDHVFQSRQRGRIVPSARFHRQREDWTGVVAIMSRSATFVTPDSPSQTKAAKSTSAEGYQLIGGGESHRVGNGDVVLIPPNAPHMYKNIQEPFRYLVIQTP